MPLWLHLFVLPGQSHGKPTLCSLVISVVTQLGSLSVPTVANALHRWVGWCEVVWCGVGLGWHFQVINSINGHLLVNDINNRSMPLTHASQYNIEYSPHYVKHSPGRNEQFDVTVFYAQTLFRNILCA